MGLDITAYSKLEPIVGKFDEETEVFVAEDGTSYDTWGEEGVFHAYPTPCFARRREDLPEGYYLYEDSFDFRAGSYGGYNSWRNYLAGLVGHVDSDYWGDSEPDYPFWRLINFSDCEGILGTASCKALLKEFEQYADMIDTYDQLDGEIREWFIQKYNDWMTAFRLAADGGCVVFH